MSFGAIITYGEENSPLPADISQWLAEVRVEQELSKPDKFAVRFEDDLCGDQPAVAGSNILEPNQLLSVVVPYENNIKCLTRGRITKIKNSSQIGGAGSWVEVHCEDRRIEMDRETIQSNWQGEENQIVSSLLTANTYTADVDIPEPKTYDEEEQLNQRGTDLAFLDKLAGEAGVSFWISYDLTVPSTPDGGYTFTETAHYRISPQTTAGQAFSLSNRLLDPTVEEPSFRISVNAEQCPNVNTFNADIDYERPTEATGAHVDAVSGEVGENLTQPDDANATGEGETLQMATGVTRTIVPVTVGGGEGQQRQSQAALREASWFIEADVSTSIQMLKDLIVPHNIIEVIGGTPELSVPYQVQSVIHVINAADHMMDVKLRSNVRGEASP